MRKTKIVCTIGPACSDEKVLEQLCLAGMNVARFNFSHGSHESQKKLMDAVKNVRERLGLPIALMLDTKGPEYRIKTFKDGQVTLNEGDEFTFTAEECEGDRTRVSVSYKGIADEMNPGDEILLNNGLMRFRVESSSNGEVKCRVESGGVLSDRKSMSFPGKVLKQIYLSEQDKSDIRFGIEQGVDFIACSFVSQRSDLDSIHDFIHTFSQTEPELIAKIENRAGVDNIEEICKACSGIMIGRGDMGVEIPFEELPSIQKDLITKCRLLGKRVITATEMLETMIHNIRPTRAEISDVANAVYDGTSALMLSGETAMGDHPVLVVQTMSKIAEQTERCIHYKNRYRNSEFKIRNTVDALSHATCGLSIDVKAKAIAVCSLSGITVRMVSRFRPEADILGITTDKSTYRRLALSWGVIPVMSEEFTSTEVMFYNAKHIAMDKLNLKKGDCVIITGGIINGTSGNTNTIKVEQV